MFVLLKHARIINSIKHIVLHS